MDKKIAWLNSIGAIESDRKEFRWYVPAADMYYSEEYIKNTPLEELQVKYERHVKTIQQPVKSKQLDDSVSIPVIIAVSAITAILTNAVLRLLL